MRCAIRSADIAENMNSLRIRMQQSVIYDHVTQLPLKKIYRDTFLYVKISRNISNINTLCLCRRNGTILMNKIKMLNLINIVSENIVLENNTFV